MPTERPPPALAASNQDEWDWHALLSDLPAGAFVARDGRFLYANQALLDLFGYANQDLVALSSLSLTAPEDRDTVMVHVRRRRRMVPELPYEVQCLRKDGSRFDAKMCGLRVLVAGEDADLVTITDITESRQTLRRAQRQQEAQQQQLQALWLHGLILDRLPTPVMAVDQHARIHYANDAVCKLLGYQREHLLTLPIFAIAPHRRPDSWQESLQSLKQVGHRNLASDWCTANGRTLQVQLSVQHAQDGELELALIALQDSGHGAAAPPPSGPRVLQFCEITGLPNQQFFRERLRSEALLAIMDHRNIAILVMGVNELQHINEIEGFATGDQVMQILTRRLSGIPKGTDLLAHLSGGEFALMVSHAPHIGDDAVLQLSRALQEAATTPIQLNNKSLQLSCNVGAVVFPRDTGEPEHVLRQAQAAMRMAISQGPNKVYSYTPQANARISARIAIETALRGALERQEFQLAFQPQVDLTHGQIVGAEALLRWRHPELGQVSPAEFIPIAEDTSLILPLGEWVLTKACEAAAQWQKIASRPIHVAVNLSPKQLQQPNIAAVIEATLIHSGLPPHLLTVELTERMLHDQQDAVADTLQHLKAIGTSIALDDFGTGYASLQSLRRLPIDVVKIDRSLVPDVTTETQDVSITRAIINMAHGLQKKVLAVGVENVGELALLCANQCDQMQGFLFSPPMDDREFTAMLLEGRALPDHMLGRKKRTRTLLVVDDDQNIVSALKRLLRKDGYHIVTAESGTEGLQKLAENEVDVIVSDQRMPGMTGVEFLRRTKELYPETIRMVLSGFTELRTITDAINEGAIYKFLTKPWDDEHVRTHIQEAFHQKEMADDNKRLDREVQEANRELAEVNGRLKHLLESQREHIHREETSLVVAREMLENMPTPVIGLDQGGMVAFMNSDAERVFAGSAGMLGLHVTDVPESALADVWRLSDGRYHDITLCGQAFRAVCRPMTGNTRSRGSLMVLIPSQSALGLPDTSDLPATG
ncbi:MAG: EAL domain-containing protein [Aquabacterium sp.]|uniref:EAL domain-containing protein n=1 Tax=Aquabacterium sp. TaxID=1872578 RepID=UPI0025B957A6|nr:EAL domain-containing protein [Aquabacterium sp.]MBI5924309.1 EAL domain-containing protein [Aquabacterium sp.]